MPREYVGDGSTRSRGRPRNGARRIASAGGPTVPSPSNFKLAVPVYYVIAPAEASSNLSRFEACATGPRGDLRV